MAPAVSSLIGHKQPFPGVHSNETALIFKTMSYSVLCRALTRRWPLRLQASKPSAQANRGWVSLPFERLLFGDEFGALTVADGAFCDARIARERTLICQRRWRRPNLSPEAGVRPPFLRR